MKKASAQWRFLGMKKKDIREKKRQEKVKREAKRTRVVDVWDEEEGANVVEVEHDTIIISDEDEEKPEAQVILYEESLRQEWRIQQIAFLNDAVIELEEVLNERITNLLQSDVCYHQSLKEEIFALQKQMNFLSFERLNFIME